jgi:CRP-like cAMP-binding protein
MHAQIDRDGSPVTPAGRAGEAVGESPGLRVARLLRHLPLFDGAVDDTAEAQLGDASVLPASAGTVLFRAGEAASVLYVVVYGRVRLSVANGASPRVFATMARGDTIGLAALLRDDVYPVTAAVLEDALLVALPAVTVRCLMADHPRIAARLVGDMGAKLARFVRDIGGFTQRSARARVARMLCELHRTAPPGASELSYDEPKRAIASRLAMTPETLSRELHALTEQGLIESRRTRVRVLDPDGLARAADEVAAAPGVA